MSPEQMGLLAAACLTKRDNRVLSITLSNLNNARALQSAGYIELWHNGWFWAISPTDEGERVLFEYESSLLSKQSTDEVVL